MLCYFHYVVASALYQEAQISIITALICRITSLTQITQKLVHLKFWRHVDAAVIFSFTSVLHTAYS